VPVADGIPLIVIILIAQAAVIPVGKPVAVPMPVALVVAWVIFVKDVLTVSVGVDDAVPTAQAGAPFTVILPIAFTFPQPPVNGIS
jgi:hypothetical protein